MAQSEQEVNLKNVIGSSSDWSLGCDISVEDMGVVIQEVKVDDIALTGDIIINEFPVNIDSTVNNVMDVDVNVMIDGINSSITESQVVPYESVIKITDLSPEATYEKKYASSAFSSKKLFDLISDSSNKIEDIDGRLNNIEVNGGGISKDIEDRLERLEELSFFERYDNDTIKTKYNIFSEREISAHGLNKGTGGSGEGGGSETLDGLLDVMLISPKVGDVLVYNGTHWNNKPQSSIVPEIDLSPYLKITDAKTTYATKNEIASFITADALNPIKSDLNQVSGLVTDVIGDVTNLSTLLEDIQKVVKYFHITEDGECVYTELNFYSEKEISAYGVNLGDGGSKVLFDNIIGVSLNNKQPDDVLVYNGTHWTNVAKSSFLPSIDLTGYATTKYVDDADKKLREDINKILGWFTLEDDVLYTEHNIASGKEISAYGVKLGSGSGSGVVAFDNIIGVSVAGKTTGDVLVYNGTHWVNTPQSEIVPDLSAYATISHVAEQNNILSRNILSEVAGTYATTSYVDEKDKALRDAIALINDWFTLEDDVLHTKYNIASDEEISAYGVNKGKGGGGGLISTVYGPSKFGTITSDDNSATFNAYAIDSIYNRVIALENDKAGYYTKEQTNSLIGTSLSPYAKATDVADTYATNVALGQLQSSHNTLRTEFDTLSSLLSSDTSEYINTWQEVVSFLDGYKDEDDLAAILSRMQSDIDTRHKTDSFNSWVTSSFTPLDVRVSDIESKYFPTSGGTISGSLTVNGSTVLKKDLTIDSSVTIGKTTQSETNIKIQSTFGSFYLGIDSYCAYIYGNSKYIIGCDIDNGYVGINKSTPAYTLDVNGTINATQSRLGTVKSGVWNGTAIANNYLANSSIGIAGTSVSLGSNISASTLQSNLGLKNLAYKDSLGYSDVGVTKSVITNLIGSSTYAPYNEHGYLPKNGGTIDGLLKVTGETSLSSLLVSGNTELQGDLRLRPSGKDFGSSLKFGDGSFCCIQEDTDDHMKITARHGVTFESSEGTITIPKLSVGINGMTVNSPATFNDFIYSSSITPKTDNYYVLGNNNYKWYGVTAYNVNVHEAITIEAGKELRFKDDNGVVHTLKYDSTKQAFVFDGNVNASGEMSAKKLNA